MENLLECNNNNNNNDKNNQSLFIEGTAFGGADGDDYATQQLIIQFGKQKIKHAVSETNITNIKLFMMDVFDNADLLRDIQSLIVVSQQQKESYRVWKSLHLMDFCGDMNQFFINDKINLAISFQEVVLSFSENIAGFFPPQSLEFWIALRNTLMEAGEPSFKLQRLVLRCFSILSQQSLNMVGEGLLVIPHQCYDVTLHTIEWYKCDIPPTLNIQMFAQGLSNAARGFLIRLDLEYCNLSNEHIEQLANALTNNNDNNNNDYSNGGDNDINDEETNNNDNDCKKANQTTTQQIIVPKKDALRELNLRGNVCRTSGMEAISRYLASPQCNLYELALSDQVDIQRTNDINDNNDDNASQQLQQQQGGDNENNSNNNIHTLYFTSLCSILQQQRQQHLVSLELSKNQLTDFDMEIFVPVLQQNVTLKILNLTENHLSDAGAMILAYGIATCHVNSSLQALYLDGNKNIGPEGWEGITLALRSNQRLERMISFQQQQQQRNEIPNRRILGLLQHYLDVNYGGKRLLSACTTSVPCSLWPIVLDRAYRHVYYGHCVTMSGIDHFMILWQEVGRNHQNQNRAGRQCNVIYYLLRQGALLQMITNRSNNVK